jgi:ABC-2 type transport system permease protein
MTDQLERAGYIALKDLRAYYLKPPLISWGILFPGVMILAFYIRSPLDIRQVIPGLVGLTLLFGATSMEAIVVTFEKRIGALERLAMAPVSPASIVLGKAASGVAFALLTGLVVTMVSTFALDLPLSEPLLFLPTLLLAAISFSLLGTFVSVAVKEIFEAMTLANYFRFPMIFLCGVFLPLPAMPPPLRAVAYALPLTYAVDALRGHFLAGEGAILPLSVDWGALVFFAAILYFASWRLLIRRLQE